MERTRWQLTVMNFWREWMRPLLVAASIAFPFKSAIADWNWVPTGSMKPTVLEGDLILVNKLAYDLKIPFTQTRLARWHEPQRGDVVVFFSPHDGIRLVKRVIGLPGDTVEMREGVLLVNGGAMNYARHEDHSFAAEIYEDAAPVVATESWERQTHWILNLPSRPVMRSFAPVLLPDGGYFVMGDSRDNSFDSRFFGPVSREAIVGRTSRVVFSLDKNHYYRPRFGRVLSPLAL